MSMNHYPPIPFPSMPSMEKLALDPYKGLKFVGSFMKGGPKPIGLGGRAARWVARQSYELAGTIPGFGKLNPKEQAAVLSKLRIGEPGKRLLRHEAEQGLRVAQQAAAAGKGSPVDVIKAEKALRTAKGTEDWAKLTKGHLPGAAEAMMHAPGQTLRAGWETMPRWQKGLFGAMIGKGLYDVAKTPAEEYGQEGMPKSRLEHLGRELGSGVGWLATGGSSLIPMIAGSSVANAAGGLPGKLKSPRRQVQDQMANYMEQGAETALESLQG
jgi:hypothetical protein